MFHVRCDVMGAFLLRDMTDIAKTRSMAHFKEESTNELLGIKISLS